MNARIGRKAALIVAGTAGASGDPEKPGKLAAAQRNLFGRHSFME